MALKLRKIEFGRAPAKRQRGRALRCNLFRETGKKDFRYNPSRIKSLQNDTLLQILL